MFIFQFLNDEIHSYVVFDIIVHFVIQKFKNKHTFLKNIQTEKAEESLILTEREERKTKYFPPRMSFFALLIESKHEYTLDEIYSKRIYV